MPVRLCHSAALFMLIAMIGLSAAGCSRLGGGVTTDNTDRPDTVSTNAEDEPFPPETLDGQRTMYLSRDDAPVYEDARESGRLDAGLKQGDKVLTFKSENGYVFIEAVGTGISGWVKENALSADAPLKKKKTKIKVSRPAEKAETVQPQPAPPAAASPAVTDPKAAVSDSF